MRLVVNVLDIAAQPALLFQVLAQLPQKHSEILFGTRIARRQFLPHNLIVFDQVRRQHIRRVISTAEPSAQVPPSIMRANPAMSKVSIQWSTNPKSYWMAPSTRCALANVRTG